MKISTAKHLFKQRAFAEVYKSTFFLLRPTFNLKVSNGPLVSFPASFGPTNSHHFVGKTVTIPNDWPDWQFVFERWC